MNRPDSASANGPGGGASTDARQIAEAVGFALAIAIFLPVVSGFALLRESQTFWRNEGGWPFWFTEVVRITFYPMLGSELCALFLFSALAVCNPALARRRRLLWPLAGLLWLWIGAIVLTIAANNVANVFAGRPLHWHPT